MFRTLRTLAPVALLLLVSCSAGTADKLGSNGESCHADLDCREPLFCRAGTCASAAGTDGDACGSNLDCARSHFCDEGQCVPDEANNGPANNGPANNGFANNGFGNNGPANNGFGNNGERNNGAPNNGFNNGPANNGVGNNGDPGDPLELACADLCETLDVCDFTPFADCDRECSSFGLDVDTVLCLARLSCDELEAGGDCLDGPPPEPGCGDGICDRGEQRSCPEDCAPDDLERCFDVCFFVTSCDEFVDRCGEEVTDQVLGACLDACQDPGAREQIVQAEGFGCETIVPLAIDAFGLGDVCQ